MPMGGVEFLIILAVILLFFGAKRVPELARSLGIGARELKKAASEDADESETKETASNKDADEGKKTKTTTSEDPASEQDGDRVEREPRAQ
jgi:sec-independent protein translocase protein TatA